MTTTINHTQTVEDIYAAFGRGDVATILEHLADDVRWDHWANHYGQRGGLEIMTQRTGKDGVLAFFEILGTLEMHDFTVVDLMAGAHQVTAQITIEFAYPNGGVLRDEELHLWTFGPDGRVAAFRHYVDTAKHLAAAGGADTR